MTDLQTLSDADLFGEVARRRELERRATEAREKLLEERVVKHLNVLFELVPEHNHQSCTDLLPLRPDDCTRCALVRVRQGESYTLNTLTLKPL